MLTDLLHDLADAHDLLLWLTWERKMLSHNAIPPTRRAQSIFLSHCGIVVNSNPVISWWSEPLESYKNSKTVRKVGNCYLVLSIHRVDTAKCLKHKFELLFFLLGKKKSDAREKESKKNNNNKLKYPDLTCNICSKEFEQEEDIFYAVLSLNSL